MTAGFSDDRRSAMRISLCIIAGNEEDKILRLLDSFAPAFDELSLVRAIGTKEPDRTQELAIGWCLDHRKAYACCEYRNAPDRDWPHVDDFAAARNLAFERATGDWLVWADCDDLASADIAHVREIAAKSEPNTLHLFPYNVVGTGKRPPRERLISRELFRAGRRWLSAIHETLLAHPGDTLQEHATPVWQHAPSGSQTSNRDRNLRILAGQLRDAPTNLFYWHQELFTRGNAADAAKSGALVMQMPNVEPSFRYQAALNLCRLETDTNKAVQHALAAFEIFPWCREAIAELVAAYMELGARSHVRHWLHVFEATPEPQGALRPWTHEPKWYGWAGDDLRERAYRWLGLRNRARGIRKRRKYRVTLIHRTADPKRAVSMRAAWLDFAHDPASVRHVFAPADQRTRDALAQFAMLTEVNGPTREITDADAPTPGWDFAERG